MNLSVSEKKGFTVLSVGDDVVAESEAREITDIVKAKLDEGKRKLALVFPTKLYPYSWFLSLVVNCNREVKKAGGELVVVQPSPDFLQVIRDVNLEKTITFLESEDRIGR